MGFPTIVYGIIAWEIDGRYLFTALLKVSNAILNVVLEHKPNSI